MSLTACVGLASLLVAAGQAPAANEDAIQKIEALNRSALASYDAKDFDKARSQLIEALVVGKRSDLDTHPVMARTYLHLGVVYLEGLKDKEKARRNFSLAVRLRPSIEVTPALATDEVLLEFEDARAAARSMPPLTPAAPPPPAEPPKKETGKAKAAEERQAAADEAADAEKEKEELRKNLAVAQDAATKERQAREHLQQQKVEKDDQLGELRQKERDEHDAKEQLQREKLALTKEVATAKADLEKQKVAADKQLADAKLASDKQLADAKLAADRRLAETKAVLDKELAALKASEKKEREAKEQLAKDKAATDKQLAEARELAKKEREAKEQLAKDKAATDKQLVAAQNSDKSEREAKEKLLKQAAEAKEKQDKERQLAEARAKEDKQRLEREQLARQKLAEGPDVPAELPRKIYCPTLDENQEGMDVYVHCAAQPSLKAKSAVLYYRPAQAVHYNAVAMERSKKGWMTAVIPAAQVKGKVLHYYLEVLDGSDKVVAKDGKPTSPNVMTLRPHGAPPAPELVSDATSSTKKTRAARRQRSKNR
jgi:hypothetical protein